MKPSLEPRNLPIALFDSGVGGLSVYKALVNSIANEQWLYIADSANAPYGEKQPEFILQRCLAISNFLRQQQPIKMLIVACNTATAVAIAQLRQQRPDLPIIGLEPAIKPALTLSNSKQIAVIATKRTIDSQKFQQLVQQLEPQGKINCLAADGLAAAIENYICASNPEQRQQWYQRSAELIANYCAQLFPTPATTGQADTLVLGCTHYPLVAELFKQQLPAQVRCLDSAEFIVNRCQQLLLEQQLQRPANAGGTSQQFFTSSPNHNSIEQAANFVLNDNNIQAASLQL